MRTGSLPVRASYPSPSTADTASRGANSAAPLVPAPSVRSSPARAKARDAVESPVVRTVADSVPHSPRSVSPSIAVSRRARPADVKNLAQRESFDMLASVARTARSETALDTFCASPGAHCLTPVT